MTNKEFWLKLLAENDTALASVIILSERFTKAELSDSEITFISDKKKWLYKEATEELKSSLTQNKEAQE